jgi:hypothetical protein
MGYYIRVLSTSSEAPTLSQLKKALIDSKLKATIESDDADDDWQSFVLSHPNDGDGIAVVERNAVVSGELGEEELDEFRESLADVQPKNAVAWLMEYFQMVKTIFAFQLLSGTDSDDGWEKLYAVRNMIKNLAPSISQADLEGFSNEDGAQITWEFSDTVSGKWNMAVLRDGKWVPFEIELGDEAQRNTFKNGLLPEGVKLL